MIADFFAASRLVSIFATGLACFSAVFGFFRFLDGIVSKALKSDLAKLIYQAADLVPVDLEKWTDRFDQLVAITFGPNLLSLRAFLASAVISCSLCATITIIAALAGVHIIDLDEAIFGYLLILFLVNLPADYMSVIKSRWLITSLGTQRPKQFLGLLVADYVITAALFVLVFFIIGTAMTVAQGRVDAIPRLFDLQMLENLVSLRAQPDLALGLFFYTTFFTTVWMTLFVLGGLAIRSMALLRLSVTYILEVDGKPLQSLGAIIGGALCLIVWAGMGLSELAQTISTDTLQQPIDERIRLIDD